MKRYMRIFSATAFIIGAVNAMAIEEAAYTVVKKDGSFEIRDYDAHILAETVVEGDLEGAGNKAFNSLFRYISGDNLSRGKVAMTSPVSQTPIKEKINMTAPVSQVPIREKGAITDPAGPPPAQNKWAVSFMMPASYTLETLPEPKDPKVALRRVPAHRMATVRYSGVWSEKRYLRNLTELKSWIDKEGLVVAGDPVWARYNPPFTLWFLRRNEILIPLEGGAEGVNGSSK